VSEWRSSPSDAVLLRACHEKGDQKEEARIEGEKIEGEENVSERSDIIYKEPWLLW
jgi:hypothetical protein